MIREHGTTVRLPEDLLADARAAQARHGSFNKLVAWAIRQGLRFEFLSPGNREFVLKIASELGRPWDVLAVLNLLVGYARGEARARKILGLFFACNESFGGNEAHGEPRAIPVDQAVIDFSQSSTETAAGGASPSPRKAEASSANPWKGAARG
jgi:hypothetical protein